MAVKRPIGKAVAAPAAANEPAMGERPAESQQPKGKKSSSLAAIFDEAKSNPGLDDGKYNCKITAFEVLEPKPDGSVSAMIEYTVLDGEDEAGESVKQYYSLADGQGNPKQGLTFLKKDLATLGYDNVPGDVLEETMETIANEGPEVSITVKNNPPWVNAYLNGLLDDGN